MPQFLLFCTIFDIAEDIFHVSYIFTVFFDGEIRLAQICMLNIYTSIQNLFTPKLLTSVVLDPRVHKKLHVRYLTRYWKRLWSVCSMKKRVYNSFLILIKNSYRRKFLDMTKKDFCDNGLSLTIKKEAIQPQQPTRLPQGGPITH